MKAASIGAWCWERGVSAFELPAMPALTLRRVATEAGVNPPSGWDTWARVASMLEAKAAWVAAHPGDVRAVPAGTVPRPAWLGPAETGPEPVPTTHDGATEKNSTASGSGDTQGRGAAAVEVGDGPAVTGGSTVGAAGSLHLVDGDAGERTVPKGWDLLAALGPVPGGQTCSIPGCGLPAIGALPDQWRCVTHPPQVGEWGAALDWAPGPGSCAPNRCYCGRHPGFTLISKAAR